MDATMTAAVFQREGSLVLKEVPVPKPGRGEVLLEVEAVSICGTDVHITTVPPGYNATPGTILGHELVGRVAELGEGVANLAIGQRVVVNPNNYCGTCVYCRKNLPNLCEHIEPLGIDYDGAFARYCKVNAKVAYPIADSVPAGEAACAEPLACALNGLAKIRTTPGMSAVVVGCGPIGLMIAMLLKAAGAGKLFLLETAPWRAELAQGLGLGEVLNPLEVNAAQRVESVTGIGADVVFDVTGSQLAASLGLVRKGGTVVLFGVNAAARAGLAQSAITQKEVTVAGTWLANATFPEAVRVLEDGLIDMSALITDEIPLAALHGGIQKLAGGQAMKVIVRP